MYYDIIFKIVLREVRLTTYYGIVIRLCFAPIASIVCIWEKIMKRGYYYDVFNSDSRVYPAYQRC